MALKVRDDGPEDIVRRVQQRQNAAASVLSTSSQKSAPEPIVVNQTPKQNGWSRDLTKPIRDKVRDAKNAVTNKVNAMKDSTANWTDKYTPTLKKGVIGGGKLAGKGLKGAGKVAIAAGAAGAGLLAGGASKARGFGSSVVSEPGSLWWVSFSVLLYLSDLFLTGFNGFNFNSFISIFTSINLKSITGYFLNAGIIAILVGYAVFRKPDSRELISFFVLTEMVWLILTTMGWSIGSVLHLVFAISVLVWLVYPQIDDKAQANLLIVACIFVDFFLFTLIAKIAPNIPYFNRLIIPIWFFLTLAFTRQSKWKSFLVFCVIMFYVFHSFSVVSDFKKIGAEYLTQQDIKSAREFSMKSWNNLKTLGNDIWKGVIALPKNIEKSFERMKAEAAGEYYTGEIDKNAKERLGVYIDNLQAADKIFFEDQPVTVWATLVAKTIKEPINIEVGCTKSKKKVDKAVVSPERIPTIESSEQEGIECTFPSGLLKEGNYEVGISADFNFLTMAYIKTYFMDREARRALISKEIDPLDRYGITDKQPVPIYTAGPVNIGLNAGSLPIMLDREFRFAITLTNDWEGKVNKVTDLYIITPKQIEMLNDRDGGYYCSGKREYLFERSSCKEIGDDQKSCDDSSLHNVFKFSTKNKNGIKDIEDYETLLCRLIVKDAIGLMGNVPIATKYFKVITKYDYSINKEVGVEVKSGDGVRTFLGDRDCSGKCHDRDGCYCPNGCKKDENEQIDYDSDCGGLKGDEKPKQLGESECDKECDDPDGCFCAVNCVKSGLIKLKDNCGGKETEQQDGVVISCNIGDKGDACSYCTDPKKPGIICQVDGTWLCAEPNTDVTYEECPQKIA